MLEDRTPPKRDRSALRLPLQTGDTSVWTFAAATACFAMALPWAGAFIAACATHDPLVAVGEAELAAPLLVVTALLVLLARRTFPSDVVLTNEGLTVIGGSYGGTTLAWSDVVRCGWRPYANFGDRLAVMGRPNARALLKGGKVSPSDRVALTFTTKDGRHLALAVSSTDDEFRSLDALRATITALRSGPKEQPAEAHDSLRVRTLPCAHCRAPLHPTSKATMTCPFCARETTVPAQVKQLVASGEQVSEAEAAIDAYLAYIREGVPLGRVRRFLLALVAAWLLYAVGFGLELLLFVHGQARAGALAWLVLAGILFVPAIAMVGYGACIDRRAARFFSLGYAATPAARPGEPPSCRHCGASLPDTARPVVRCLFCRADNVLGIDLTVRLERDVAQKASIDEATSRARRDRAVWSRRGRVLGASLLAVLGLLALIIDRGRPVVAMGGAHDLARVTRDPFETAREPALSPKGDLVAYTKLVSVGRHQPDPNLALVAAAGGFGHQHPLNIDFETPDWMPDGTTVVGVDRTTLATADTQKPLTSGGFLYTDAVLTPRVRPSHPGGLALVLGGNLLVGTPPAWFDDWTHLGPGSHPAWFSDGASLAFTREGRIWVAKLDPVPALRVVSTSSCPVDYAAPEPGGTRLAYVSQCGRESNIVIQSLDTGTSTNVTRGSAPITDLRWQQGWLLFTADDAVFRLRPP